MMKASIPTPGPLLLAVVWYLILAVTVEVVSFQVAVLAGLAAMAGVLVWLGEAS